MKTLEKMKEEIKNLMVNLDTMGKEARSPEMSNKTQHLVMIEKDTAFTEELLEKLKALERATKDLLVFVKEY